MVYAQLLCIRDLAWCGLPDASADAVLSAVAAKLVAKPSRSRRLSRLFRRKRSAGARPSDSTTAAAEAGVTSCGLWVVASVAKGEHGSEYHTLGQTETVLVKPGCAPCLSPLPRTSTPPHVPPHLVAGLARSRSGSAPVLPVASGTSTTPGGGDERPRDVRRRAQFSSSILVEAPSAVCEPFSLRFQVYAAQVRGRGCVALSLCGCVVSAAMMGGVSVHRPMPVAASLASRCCSGLRWWTVKTSFGCPSYGWSKNLFPRLRVLRSVSGVAATRQGVAS